MRKIYCGSGFNFTQSNWKEHASEDWRAKIILKGDLRSFLYPTEGGVVLSESLVYGGPFYFEKETEDGGGTTEAYSLVKSELKLIDDCTDCIFILDRSDCLGTVAELMYAASKGKELHIVYLDLGEDKETESTLHNPCWWSLKAAQILTDKIHLFRCKNQNEIEKSLIEIRNGL